MVRVLVIGYAPDAVDFSDPTIPPGLDAAKVASGIEEDLRLMHARGWEAEHLPIRTDEDLKQRISSHLQGKSFDCIVIGGGVRMTEKHVPELERVVNTIRESAPLTPIAFNSDPSSSGEAAARWVLQQLIG